MWTKKGKNIQPLFYKTLIKQPAYNVQFKTLPKIYVQNASIEISKINVINKYNSITGKRLFLFLQIEKRDLI